MPLKIKTSKSDIPKAGNPLSSKLDAELTQAREKNRSAAYTNICKQDFFAQRSMTTKCFTQAIREADARKILNFEGHL